MRKLIERIKAPTPKINKVIGKISTVLLSKAIIAEGLLIAYDYPRPDWLIYTIIGLTIITGYNAQKVEK